VGLKNNPGKKKKDGEKKVHWGGRGEKVANGLFGGKNINEKKGGGGEGEKRRVPAKKCEQ